MHECLILPFNVLFMMANPLYDTYGEINYDLQSDEYFRCIEGNKQFFSKKMIRMKPNKKYQIDVDLKSIGVLESYVYLCIKCFSSENENSFISSSDANYVENSNFIIGLFSDNQILIADSTGKKLTCWNDESKSSHARQAAFYFDGNTDRIPDATLEYITVKDICITFNDLPKIITDRIIIGTTKIRNHYSSGSFVYPFNGKINHEWTHISRIISGINKKNVDVPDKFRNGTQYFKVGLLVNYQQDKTHIIALKNCKISMLLE
jgi:hypothetical protein